MPHTPISLLSALLAFALLLATPAAANEVAVSLRGSPSSMVRQNTVAKKLGYEFVKTPEQLPVLVDEGEFVELPGNEDYEVLESVSYPFARPEVRLFVERLAAQYHEDTGEKLVVTSLTRPSSEQPRNSHQLSVHPAGIAIDLRISSTRSAQRWLEAVLLKLERQDLLDITRERYPPHYHVALFPKAYRAHVEGMIGSEALAEAMDYKAEPVEEPVEAVETEKAPVMTAAAAVPAIEKEDFEWKNFTALGIPLLAALFFGLGYWRGIARRRNEKDAGKDDAQGDNWTTFTITST